MCEPTSRSGAVCVQSCRINSSLLQQVCPHVDRLLCRCGAKDNTSVLSCPCGHPPALLFTVVIYVKKWKSRPAGDLRWPSVPIKKKATKIMIRRDEISHNTSVIPSACVEQWSISSYPLYLCSRWAVTELLCLDSIWPPETGAGRCGGADYSCIVSVGERRLCCSSPCWFERALTNKSSLQSSSL